MSIPNLMEDLRATKPYLRRAERYHEGKRTRRTASVLLPPELLYLQEVISWASLVDEVLEERVEIKDVSAPGFEGLTEQLRKWRQDQDLAGLMESPTTMEQLVLGRGYVTVSADADDPQTPIFAVESAHHMIHKADQRTGKVMEALREYGDPDRPQIAYYTPGKINYQVMTPITGRWVPDPEYKNRAELPTGLSEVPVMPFINRARVGDRWGVPNSKRIWHLQEDVSRCLTDLAAACALMAIPQRVVFGADGNDMIDPATGQQVPAAQLYMARLLTFTDAGGKIAEYAAAQLQQFTSTMVAYARTASSLSATPTPFFGVASEANPASGDSQRADMDRLNKRAERVCRGQKKPWKTVYRLGAKISGETDADALAAIDVEFQDPASTTVTQRSTAVAQLANIRRLPDALLTPEYLMGKLGISPELQKTMNEGRDLPALEALMKQLDATAVTPPAPVTEPAVTA